MVDIGNTATAVDAWFDPSTAEAERAQTPEEKYVSEGVSSVIGTFPDKQSKIKFYLQAISQEARYKLVDGLMLGLKRPRTSASLDWEEQTQKVVDAVVHVIEKEVLGTDFNIVEQAAQLKVENIDIDEKREMLRQLQSGVITDEALIEDIQAMFELAKTIRSWKVLAPAYRRRILSLLNASLKN